MSADQTLEQGRSTNLAVKAVTAAGWLADWCFKAASKAGLGLALAVGAGVSAAVLDGLTGLARASAAAASAVWGIPDEPVAELEAARDTASGLSEVNSSKAEEVRVRVVELSSKAVASCSGDHEIESGTASEPRATSEVVSEPSYLGG
jgi:hypothetical protein